MLKVYAENFRSFPVIDWEVPNGLTLIDGINKDTGGSNMAGKTTLLDAWFWCRYGWLPKWKGPKGGSVDAVVRRKNNQPVGRTLVRVTESFGASTITIERQRPNRLLVWKDGNLLPGADQKSLEALVGSPERFLVCVYMPQRRQRSFYWMGDNERTELISIVSGLEDVERAAIEAKTLRDEAQDVIEQTSMKIEILEGQIKAFPARVKELIIRRDEADRLLKTSVQVAHRSELLWDEYSYDAETKVTQEVSEKIDPLVDQLADLKFSVQALQGSYDSKKNRLENLPPLDPKYRMEIEQAERQIKKAELVYGQINALENQIAMEARLATEATEGICSQCEQPFPEQKRNEKAARHWDRVEHFRITKSEIKLPDLYALESTLTDLMCSQEQRKAEHDREPSQIQAAMAELQTQINDKKNQERLIQRDIQSVKDEYARAWKSKQSDLKHAIDLANREVKHHQSALNSAQEMLDLMESDEVKIRKEIIEADLEIRTWKKKLDEALDLVEIFGPKGYRAICYDGLIEKLSDRSGQLLSIMTQGLYSTRLDQLGQDSKGNQKVILKPIIIKGGSEVPADDLSGGAEERVALSYDVAIAEAAGEGLPLLLDEVLSGLDAIGKTEAMALLEEVSKTRPVLVVDHASEFKAMFSKVVRVIYENEESRLEVA